MTTSNIAPETIIDIRVTRALAELNNDPDFSKLVAGGDESKLGILPTEVLCRIFSNMAPRDLQKKGLVSRKCHLIGKALPKQHHMYLIIDKSGSMRTGDMPNMQSRWEAVTESIPALAERAFQLFPDPITLYTFSSGHTCHQDLTSPRAIRQILVENQPQGGTNLLPVIQNVFQDYLQNQATTKGYTSLSTILVVTDGVPNKNAGIIEEIIKISKAVNIEAQFRLAFVQVGGDPQATAFLTYLTKQLDQHNLSPDIVNICNLTEVRKIGFDEALYRQVCR